MWTSRLFWKVFFVYFCLNVALALVFVWYESWAQRRQLLARTEEALHDQAIVLRSQVEDLVAKNEEDALQPIFRRMAPQTKSGARMTLVRADGVVLADSEADPQQMDNHRKRPEIAKALAGQNNALQRYSKTLHRQMLYVAIPLEQDGSVVAAVRTAIDVQAIEEELRSRSVVLWVIALVVGVLAVGLTYVVVGRIINPLSELTRGAQAIAAGNYDDRVKVASSDELGSLGDAFNRMRTEMARRLEQLNQYNQQLSTVLGSMVEGVLAVDAELRIILANDASRRLLQLTAQSVVGRSLVEAVRVRPLNDAVADVLSGRRQHEIEFELPGGARRILMLRATRLPGDLSSGVVVVLHDVTELRRLESLRSEFVANVSHELKTPLAAIKAYAETLRLGALHDPDHNTGFVARIEEQADRLDQLIVDMLHLARVESGEAALEFEDVSLDRVAESCVEQFAETARAKKIQLEIASHHDGVRVRADQEGLETILSNLVDNAIKYTPLGGQVTIRWRREPGEVILEVSDTGIGIPANSQSRIFERFYRVDKARSREVGGTGLGLSIVKHLAQAHGGTVSVSSEEGEGSTFQVRLPLG